MKRRTLLTGTALALLPQSTKAQNGSIPPLLARYMEMLNTQNWDIADEIISESYSTLYPYPNVIPGRDAYKQRRASDPIYALFASVAFEIVSFAESELGHIFFYAELLAKTHDGREVIAPYIGFLVVRQEKIDSLEAWIDENYVLSLM